jgi:DNA-binding transcriptional ArsR family regulator
MTVSDLTTVGALLADRTRATMLVALMDGRARTAGELARLARVAPSTTSGHLARLVDTGFLEVVSQGRHRYFRISSDEIGLLLEAVGGLDLPGPQRQPTLGRAPDGLRYARSCYDHLAGQLAVAIHDRLIEGGHVENVDGNLRLTKTGTVLLRDLGVATWSTQPNRPSLRRCLDWTERRDHLGGPAAAALFTTLLERRWIARGVRPRSVRVTETGRRGLTEELRLTLPSG